MENNFTNIVPAGCRSPNRVFGRYSPQRSLQIGAMPGPPLIRLIEDLQQECDGGLEGVFCHRFFSLSEITARRHRNSLFRGARMGILGGAHRQVNAGQPGRVQFFEAVTTGPRQKDSFTAKHTVLPLSVFFLTLRLNSFIGCKSSA